MGRTNAAAAIRRHLSLLVFYLIFTLFLTWPLARQLGSAIPGDSFDGWQNYWNLWWVKTALLNQNTHPYFTTFLYYPSGVSLWFQTLNIFNGLASLPVQLAGNLFWAYNAVVFFSFVFSGYGTTLLATYALAKAGARPGLNLHLSALLVGTIYTFSPFHFAHLLGHMQVFSLQFLPFYILYLLRALRPGDAVLRRREALLAALFLILSALCDWYFALYLGWFTLLYLLWLAAKRKLRPAHFYALAITFGATLLVTSPLLAPMIRESLRYDFMRPPAGQIENLSADVLAFLLPSVQHPLWGSWVAGLRARLPASPSENTLFIGFVPLLLALYGLWRRRLRLGFWALAALIFALFALGPVLHVAGNIITLPNGRALPLPYALLLKLPFLEIARTVARYDLLVMLALGILAGGGLHLLIQAHPKRRWLPALVLILVLTEFLPSPYPISPPDTPAFYHTLANDPRSGAVLNLPMNWDRPGYLLYQTVHGKPLTTGYISRTDPRTYPGRLPVLSHFRRLAPDINTTDAGHMAPTIFDFLRVRWVISDRYKMPGPVERQGTEALLAAIFAGQQPVYRDNRLTVYETVPPETPLPFIELGSDWGPWQPGPVRDVENSATIIIHSPDGAPRRLLIVPAPASVAPFRLLNEQGEILGQGDEDSLLIALDLVAGANRFTLQAMAPGLSIQHLELVRSR